MEFRGYEFYDVSNGHVEFKFDEQVIIEAQKFGISNESAFDVMCMKYSTMVFRDLKIANFASQKSVRSIIDIGGDRGGLAIRIKKKG